MTNVQQRIDETLSHFDHLKRGEKTITILKDDAPEALKDAIHEAHGDRMPDDWIYDTFETVLSNFSGYDIKDADGLEEQRPEVVESCVSSYTSDLTEWLHDSPYNVYYLTEAIESGATDGFSLLAVAQSRAIDEIAGCVIDYLIKE